MKKVISFSVSSKELSREQISSMLSDAGYNASREIDRLNEFQNEIQDLKVELQISIEG